MPKQLTFFDESGAIFSEDRRYRYSLWRIWDRRLPSVNFIGLNPSTADEETDDATITRCRRFATDWGYGSLTITNLFAYRATSPKEMKKINDPIGSDNNKWLITAATSCHAIIVAWGEHGRHLNRDMAIVDLLRQSISELKLYCLGITKKGSPRHPLYLKKNTDLIEYEGRK